MKTWGREGVIWRAAERIATRARLRAERDDGSIARVSWLNMGALALALVLGCRPAPPPYPGSLISVSVRLLPAGARVGRVTASADAAAAMALGSDGQDGWSGAIALQPGPHTVAIEAFNDAGIRVGSASFLVSSVRGSPALLDATVQVLAPGDTGAAGRPTIDAIVAPGSSVAQGERMLLQGVVGTAPQLALSWTAAPSGCGTFAQPAAASTEWTAIAPGPCTVALTAGAANVRDRRSITVVVRSQGRSFEYPLQVAPGGRHLIDQRGTPFLIKGETAWLALANLTEAEQERYLADRGAKGFNLVEVSLINHDYTSTPNPTPPANRAGEQPFLKPGDFSTPNDAYFDRAVAFVERAAAHGIVVLLAPTYLGFDGAREGWWQELNAPGNTREVCAGFGRYLGTRFKGKKNLLWLAGGDFAPPAGSEGESRHREILDGIRGAGASQPWTGHWNVEHLGGISSDQAAFRDAMDLNGVYQYASPYRYVGRAYDLQPVHPVYLLESTYEHEHPGTDSQPFRKAWWWTMLSGGTGVLWSNTFLWMCETARSTYRVDYGDVDHAVSSWSAELESQGTLESLHLHAFFEGLPWHRLVPAGPLSGLRRLVGSWGWLGERRIVAAATREGDLLVAYVPPTGSRSRSFTLDLSGMRGPARARWYDPSTGGWFSESAS